MIGKSRPEVKLRTGGRYAEIYGSDGLAFSLLNPQTMEALHFPTMCKDFFTDAFYSQVTGQKTDIHGFHWEPQYLARHRKYEMALSYKGKRMGDLAENIGDWLNRWEKPMNIPLSLVRPDSSGELAVIQFDEMWTTRPVMVSLLTLLMRLGPTYDGTPVPKFLARIVKEGNPFGQYDKSELSKAGVVDLLEQIYDTGAHPHPKQEYKQYGSAYGCHHSGGLIAYTTGRATG